ncbi:MAG TPA: hypothetical protein VLT33_11240 [Labilithrix sp.]|nr:hypothetical protein [Labilithrix sp.]
MRLSCLFAAAVLAVQVIACSSGSTTGTGTGTGGASGGGAGGSGGAPSTGAGTCDSACAYYLACKGADGVDNRAACNQQCAAQNNSADQLVAFQKLDCAKAIEFVEGPGGSSGSTSSGGTTSSGGSTDCKGCVWDGSSCIYLTGSGGNYFACDRSCCP